MRRYENSVRTVVAGPRNRAVRRLFDGLSLAIALAVPFTLGVPNASEAAEVDALDYMVQNVCVDGAGKVLHVSPLDPNCARQRDLRVGELLPYHKHDWPSANQAAARPQGDQRGDSLPLTLPGVGVVALHTFDFGDGVRRFGEFDGANGDGLSLVSVQGEYFGSLMTLDHTAGIQLFVNTDKCKDAVGLDSVQAGWAFAPVALDARPNGMSQAHVRRVKNLGGACPNEFTYSSTNWYFVEFKPMTGPSTEGKRSLHTLISEHFAGPDPAKFNHLERMYFSRELGRMRWERWQNFSAQRRSDDIDLSSELNSEGRCVGGVGAPKFPGNWVRVRCREWTNIVPSSNPAGDSISEWLSPIIQKYQGTPLEKLVVP